MYGKRRYRHNRVIESEVVPPGAPTFVCSKCKVLKLQSTGYTDISLILEESKLHKPYRICTDCTTLLDAWIK